MHAWTSEQASAMQFKVLDTVHRKRVMSVDAEGGGRGGIAFEIR
jgi:hypothetical protein